MRAPGSPAGQADDAVQRAADEQRLDHHLIPRALIEPLGRIGIADRDGFEHRQHVAAHALGSARRVLVLVGQQRQCLVKANQFGQVGGLEQAVERGKKAPILRPCEQQQDPGRLVPGPSGQRQSRVRCQDRQFIPPDPARRRRECCKQRTVGRSGLSFGCHPGPKLGAKTGLGVKAGRSLVQPGKTHVRLRCEPGAHLACHVGNLVHTYSPFAEGHAQRRTIAGVVAMRGIPCEATCHTPAYRP